MALFYECIQKCARKLLDTADIVRDGDVTPSKTAAHKVTHDVWGEELGSWFYLRKIYQTATTANTYPAA